MKSYNNIDNYITQSSDLYYGEVIKYIETHGADFHTEDKEKARLYFEQMSSQYKGGLYVVFLNNVYKFITP